MGISRIGVLQTDDSFGRDAILGAERGFTNTKLKPVFVEVFDRNKPDFGPAAARVVKENLQAVLVLGSGSAVGKAMVAIRATGSKATLVSLSNTASGGFVKDLGDNARGTMVTQVFPSERALSMPIVKEANDLLRANKSTVELSPAMLEGYASAKVLVEALRRAGKKPTSEGVQRALEEMSRFDLGGIELGFSPTDHTGLESSDLSIVGANGRFQR
jgi:ABC-type branched-subunit amino acid transport system substrate-binding protein